MPTIFEGHHAALAMRHDAARKSSFLISAGNGAFLCTLTAAPDLSTGKDCVCISAHTWLHTDQLADDQYLAACSDVPAERLGTSLLRPLSLRHL